MRKLISLTVLGLVLLAGCTANRSARKYGGTTTVEVPAAQKLVNVTWKENSLWLLTRPARAGETPETYTFKESSSFGWVEGTVIIKEH